MIATFFMPNHYSGMVTKASSEPRIPREMYPDQVGERMRILREAFGLKASEIADMLGVERTYWTRFEKGRRAISDEVAYALVDRFGVTLDFLLLGRWDKLPLDVAEKLRKVKDTAAN